ncbi:unnamed protein product [Trifolium pratense]|uniref:Uncharacterized protein n=1 Tax=Trifolium pratense TaxID=57577 RepID=A0ACB0LWQ4_TRIPR|nr:unnamed protein product [Trifolium pratense]
MAWDLWSSSFDQVSYDRNYSEILEWHCDYFGCGRDEIEEDALNVESCVQVLRILLTKADTEIEELEKDLMCLQNELAWTENENWPEICCNALNERINRLDVAVTNLKSGHADGADMQLLLNSEPAETLHEIVKALHKDHCQDTHGQHLEENIMNPIVNVTEHAPDNGSNNIDSNDIIMEGGEEDSGASDLSKSSEYLIELHGNRSDDPEKTETKELLALSPVRSPDLEVVSSVPYHSDRMILSDTLDDKVTKDEDVRQSQLVTTDTCQILNPFLSKGNGNIPSEAKEENTDLKENVCSDVNRLAIIKGSQLILVESGQSLNPILSKENKNIPSETKEVNITVKEENVCSDDHRLAIIKGSQLIAKNTGQILNPFSSKGSGNIPSEAKIVQEKNTNLNGNVCSNTLEIIKTMEMCSRFGTGQQEETENSDLATKLCHFAPKTARRVCWKESKVAPDEDLESMNVPLQIVYPQKLGFGDTESSAFKENNGNNALQVIKFETATLSAENSVSISLPGMQMKNVLCTRLQLTDEEKPQAQDTKSKVAVNFSKPSKRFTLKSKAQGKKKPEFEACSAKELFPLEVFTSTSKNVTTKRQRKPKNEFMKAVQMGQYEIDDYAIVFSDSSDDVSTKRQRISKNKSMNSKITKKAVQMGQYEFDDYTTIVLSDSDDDVSTKRQRKPNSCTAGTTLNELTNSKVTKRSVQLGQHETAGNAIVPYDRKFSELQKKRRVSELSITSEVQNSIVNYLDTANSDNGKSLALGDHHNESSALLPITSTETMETLMQKTLPALKGIAKTLNMKGLSKLRKADLVKELLKRLSSC